MCATNCVEVRGQPARAGSSLPTYGSWVLNLGHQTWQQVLYPLRHLPGPQELLQI